MREAEARHKFKHMDDAEYKSNLIIFNLNIIKSLLNLNL